MQRTYRSRYLKDDNHLSAPGCLRYVEDEKLPNYVGIILNQYKDSYTKQIGFNGNGFVTGPMKVVVESKTVSLDFHVVTRFGFMISKTT